MNAEVEHLKRLSVHGVAPIEEGVLAVGNRARLRGKSKDSPPRTAGESHKSMMKTHHDQIFNHPDQYRQSEKGDQKRSPHRGMKPAFVWKFEG